MGDVVLETRVLYLTACDAHARSSDGNPMVAGTQFKAPNGYPVLPWGCGPLYGLSPNSPRWLVLQVDGDGLSDTPTGLRITSAKVLVDGTQQDALRYLHSNGASGMPYVGRRRRGGGHAVMTVGSLGTVEVEGHGVVSAGEGSRIKGGAGMVASAGPRSTLEGAEFVRMAMADQSKATADRFSLISAGFESQIDAGDGSIVLAGSGSTIKAGAGSRAVVESGGALDLGERATGVGQSGTRYRGCDGALFVALTVALEGAPQVLAARVGLDGIRAGQWYVVSDGRFVEATQ